MNTKSVKETDCPSVAAPWALGVCISRDNYNCCIWLYSSRSACVELSVWHALRTIAQLIVLTCCSRSIPAVLLSQL